MTETVTLAVAGGNAIRASVADSFWTRGKGLLGKKTLPSAEGLLIKPCSSVHMMFMRFALDIVYLDDEMRVVKVVHDLRPWRFSGARGAKMALELQSGEAERLGVEAGMGLEPVAERPVEERSDG